MTRQQGIVTMSLTADQTNALEEGRYVYDLEILQTSSSTITRLLRYYYRQTTSNSLIHYFFIINIQQERVYADINNCNKKSNSTTANINVNT